MPLSPPISTRQPKPPPSSSVLQRLPNADFAQPTMKVYIPSGILCLAATALPAVIATSFVRLSFVPDANGDNDPTMQPCFGGGAGPDRDAPLYRKNVWYRTAGNGVFSFIGEEVNLAQYKVSKPDAQPDEGRFSLRMPDGKAGPIVSCSQLLFPP